MASKDKASPSERIVLKHPDQKGRPTMTRRQLEQVWGPLGWVEDKSATVSPDPLPEPDVEPVTRSTGQGGNQ